jgi:YD repeat-containing protein
VCECETRFLERKEASNLPGVMKMSETRCSVLNSMTGAGGRLTEETTPQGTVDYMYDAAGRRASMTVAGQTEIDYAYDNANRLLSITDTARTSRDRVHPFD